ncbi:MAG: DUF493 domain-containing protein [Methylococcales bacterium]|nr:DUF493 domain-containing protein [Methylococcales bacterium]
MEFPCEFAIKAMGLATPELRGTVYDIVQKHCAETDILKVDTKASREGKYHSITITINATGRNQLDLIYIALSANASILMAL